MTTAPHENKSVITLAASFGAKWKDLLEDDRIEDESCTLSLSEKIAG